jgi:signal transduction histidine kinase
MSFRARLMLAALGPAFILLTSAWFVYGALETSIRANDDVVRSRDTVISVNVLLQATLDQESAERGYVISGDRAFLEPYDVGRARFAGVIAQVSALTGADAGQQERLFRIAALHDQWEREIADRAISAVEAGDPQVAIDIARSGDGKTLVDQIRVLTADMEERALATLEATQLARDEAYLVAQRLIVGAPLLAAILSVVFSLALAHQAIGGVRRVRSAATALTAGDLTRRATVGSNDEVGELADAFNAMAGRLETLAAIESQTSTRLRDQASRLEEANNELETFSYSVSHDLRAPLRTIDGFGQILLEDHADRLDDEGLRLIARMQSASQRMGTIIEDLLQLARVHRVVIEREAVNLGAIARAVADRLRKADPERGDVKIVIADGLVTEADPGLAHIVLDNLLSNAWKFTIGTDAPTIRVERTGPDVFRVADNGAGFDMTYEDKLFQPFQRLHHVEEFPGTGIGLATVQRILRRHGGSARAVGRPGAGATVWFSFDHALAPEEAQ